MHEEDLKEMKCVEEILEKELRTEMKKVKDANAFAPGQTKTIGDAVDLMLKMKEYEQWMESDSQMQSYGYSQRRNPMNGQYMGRMNYPSYGYSYNMNRSGHSTRDRMVACLEDLMGEAKNEYEAQMISDAIRYVQNGQ